MNTQNMQIYKHLSDGKRITPIQALELFGCFRLSARIYDIKKMGYKIKKNMIELDNGKYFAEYYL